MFDNTKPMGYPEFKPAEVLGDEVVIIKEGDFIVDEHGSLLEVTHGNYEYSISDSSFDREINKQYYRAKYLGNRDDSLGCANQIRFASREEIEEVENWLNRGVVYKVCQNGQLSFI